MNFILVDDEHLLLQNIARVIKEAVPDCSLKCFQTATEALKYAENNMIDVSFLDIEIPGMNGIILAKKLKDIYGKTNIVFVTGYSEYSGQAFSLHASGYVLKPATTEAILKELDNLRYPVNLKPETGVFVQTFGNFEVFVNGKPLAFPRSKAKELFAFLIDRQGTYAKTAEIAAVLWEDKEYTRSIQNQTQNMISYMMSTLRNAGINDIIIKSHNQLAVDKTKLECDYYRMLNGDTKALNTYGGEYMTNYSWAEMTAGALFQKQQ